MITQSRLQQLLNYDPETGVFIWLISTTNAVRVGAVAGSINGYGYIHIKIDARTYKAHRLAWLYVHGVLPPKMLDHINQIKTDNRLCNLRLATRAENNQNSGKQANNTSGHKGVHWNKRDKKWVAQCRANGVRHYLGYYDSAEEASIAYKDFASEHHGKFFNMIRERRA